MLVWDGTDDVRIPAAMGTPREDQMQGSSRERLAELCGRVCYDSLGKGRNSAEYHKHILEVGHLSVYEHGTFTFEFNGYLDLSKLVNHPGLWIDGKRLTMNLRTVRDWSEHGLREEYPKAYVPYEIFPQIYGSDLRGNVCLVEPNTVDEAWVSLYLVGSRGFSHELVRHGDFTAISQRSTRYVDESESPWCRHPELHSFPSEAIEIMGEMVNFEANSKELYNRIVQYLEARIVARGLDKATARKQARGAARGYLGNALQTELIFSASMSQWNRMISQRFSVHADGEIREVFGEQVIPSLKQSRYSEFLNAS